MNKYYFIFKAIYFETKIKFIYLILNKYYNIESVIGSLKTGKFCKF